MKKNFKRIVENLKERTLNNKGMQIIEMLIIIAIIATIAITTIPKLNKQVNATLSSSISRINSIDVEEVAP